MNPPHLAIQYLESPPRGGNARAVQARLRAALDRLPIDAVLLGWALPPRLEEAVAAEVSRARLPLYRWQPLLTANRHAESLLAWRVIGATGNPVAGHNDLAVFTFLCPNRHAVLEWVLEQLESIAASGLYQGFFFDRIRFPSPAATPWHRLACFCPECSRQAAEAGLNLTDVRRALQELRENGGAPALTHFLLTPPPAKATQPLQAFLAFRAQSITRFVRLAAQTVRAYGLAVGLDCFSPSLAFMVGQDLPALDACSDWIKLMTYPRVFGPAGLAFEYLDLARWLMENNLSAKEALQTLTEASGLPFPPSLDALAAHGLEAECIRQEIQRGRALGIRHLLAGLALVTMPGIHTSDEAHLRADFQAAQAADGLVLSWDLWHIPSRTLTVILEPESGGSNAQSLSSSRVNRSS